MDSDFLRLQRSASSIAIRSSIRATASCPADVAPECAHRPSHQGIQARDEAAQAHQPCARRVDPVSLATARRPGADDEGARRDLCFGSSNGAGSDQAFHAALRSRAGFMEARRTRRGRHRARSVHFRPLTRVIHDTQNGRSLPRRNSRMPLNTTSRLVPMSANTAIHSVA